MNPLNKTSWPIDSNASNLFETSQCDSTSSRLHQFICFILDGWISVPFKTGLRNFEDSLGIFEISNDENWIKLLSVYTVTLQRLLNFTISLFKYLLEPYSKLEWSRTRVRTGTWLHGPDQVTVGQYQFFEKYKRSEVF